MSAQPATALSDKKDARYVLSNRTPKVLEISNGEGDRLVVAPLGQRILSANRLRPFERELSKAQLKRLVQVRPFVDPESQPVWATSFAALGGILILVALGLGVFLWGTLWRREIAVLAFLGGLLIAVVLYTGGQRERSRQQRERTADLEAGDLDFGLGAVFSKANETVRMTRQYGTLVLVVLVGALGPAVAIAMTTDMKTFMVFKGGLDVYPGLEAKFISRAVQVIYVAVLTLFPALMYFMFDRQRVGTMRGQWIRSIFRADARMETLSDVNARYGDQLSEASYHSSDATKLLGGRRSPIFVATILFALGFTILVARTESFDFPKEAEAAAQVERTSQAAMRSAEAATAANQASASSDAVTEAAASAQAVEAATSAVAASEEVREIADEQEQIEASAAGATVEPGSTTTAAPEPVDETLGAEDAAAAAATAAGAAEQAIGDRQDVQSTPFFQLLNPRPTAAGMAFLGAYFFAVYLVLRGTLRGDLRPKVYNQVTARLVTVVVIAYLINVLFSGAEQNRVIWSVAFLAGVVPTAVLRWIGENAPGNLGTLFGAAFSQQRPLTRVDGIDLYERERLAAEGINDVEGLAHADIVTTMIRARIPMERLVDWADQAVLLLHLEGPDEKPKSEVDPVAQLRQLGIRTASDFIEAANPEGPMRDEIERTLGRTAPDLDGLLEIIEREPVMRNILWWYESDLGHPDEPAPCVRVGQGPDEDRQPPFRAII